MSPNRWTSISWSSSRGTWIATLWVANPDPSHPGFHFPAQAADRGEAHTRGAAEALAAAMLKRAP